MDILFKCAAIGIVGTTAVAVLKKDSTGIAFLLGTAVVLYIIANAINALKGVKDFADTMIGFTGLSGFLFTPVIKITGIGIMTRITADICRDAGQNAPASALEVVGSICAVYISMPLIKTVLDMIGSLIE